MIVFADFLKSVRREAKITQQELADVLGVSKVLIGKLESNMRQPSKGFILKLSEKLKISPNILFMFLTITEDKVIEPSAVEKKLIAQGLKLQEELIKNRAKNLIISNA